ncbi:MAG: hypothetical protein AAF368_10515 [Planctomycetota bacterium]
MISTLTLIALSFSASAEPAAPLAIEALAAQEAPLLQDGQTTGGDEKKDEGEKGKKKRAQKKGDAKKGEGKKKGAEKKGTEGEGRRGRRRRGDGEARKELVKKFDADGDGKLNEAERKTLREHMQKQREERKGDGEGKGKRRGDGAGKKGGAKKKGDDGSAA